AALLRTPAQQGAAQLDHRLRAQHEPSGQSRRMVDRQYRSDPRGDHRVARGGRAGDLLCRSRTKVAQVSAWRWLLALATVVLGRLLRRRRKPGRITGAEP